MVTSGTVGCRPMGRAAEEHIEKATNGMRKKLRK
jgi:hypothetical protein